MTRELDPTLVSILACPEDKGPLYYIAAEEILYNPRSQRVYRIADGIPIMLIDESETVDATEHARLMGVIESGGIAPTFESD